MLNNIKKIILFILFKVQGYYEYKTKFKIIIYNVKF